MPIISFHEAYLKLNKPEYITWVLYWVGEIRYDTCQKEYTVRILFLPKLVALKLADSPLNRRELNKHLVSFDTPVKFFARIIAGNEYDLDGYNYYGDNIYNNNHLQLKIYNAEIIKPTLLRQIELDIKLKLSVGSKIYYDQPFILFQSCHHEGIVLIPCFEIARYCFFTKDYFVEEITAGTLFYDKGIQTLERISELEYGGQARFAELDNKLTDVNSKNIASRLLYDSAYRNNVNLISSKLKDAFYSMPGQSFQATTAFIHCALPYNEPIRISATFVKIGVSENENPVFMINQILDIDERDYPVDQHGITNSTGSHTEVKTTPMINIQWPYVVDANVLRTESVLQINCQPYPLPYKNHFVFKETYITRLKGDLEGIILDITIPEVPYLILPIIKKIPKVSSSKRINALQYPAPPKDYSLEYEQLASHVLRLFKELGKKGWNITYLSSWDEATFINEPIQLSIGKRSYKVIVAKASLMEKLMVQKKERTYSFLIFECLDLSYRSHLIAIIHNKSLSSLSILKIRQVVQIANDHKFAWKTCRPYLKTIGISLEEKVHRYWIWNDSKLGNNFISYFERTKKKVYNHQLHRFFTKKYGPI